MRIRSDFAGRLRGLGCGVVFAALSAGGTLVAGAAGDPFVQDVKGVTVDWRRGRLSAPGAAAGDWRMPSAEVARAGAERRARNAGRARMGEALRALPLGGGRHLEAAAITRAVERARTVSVEYQSNGGVELKLEIAFGDWAKDTPTHPDAAPAPAVAPGAASRDGALSLRLAEGPLGAAPVVLVGEQEVGLARVRYAPVGELAADAHPIGVHVDKKGRLVPTSKYDGDLKDFANRDVVIYVQKVVR